MTLTFDRWPWKSIGYLCNATSSFVHHFVAKLELQSGNSKFGSKSTILLAMWPWNLMDDLEKQCSTSPKQHEALCIISSSCVNSNWSYGPKPLSWGLTSVTLTFDLWPWPFVWTSISSLVIILKISWWFDDANIVKKVWQTEIRTELTTHKVAWSQQKAACLRMQECVACWRTPKNYEYDRQI